MNKNSLVALVILIVKIVLLLGAVVYLYKHGAKLVGSVVKRIKALPATWKTIKKEQVEKYTRSVNKI